MQPNLTKAGVVAVIAFSLIAPTLAQAMGPKDRTPMLQKKIEIQRATGTWATGTRPNFPGNPNGSLPTTSPNLPGRPSGTITILDKKIAKAQKQQRIKECKLNANKAFIEGTKTAETNYKLGVASSSSSIDKRKAKEIRNQAIKSVKEIRNQTVKECEKLQ